MSPELVTDGAMPGQAALEQLQLYDLDADPYELDNLIDSVNHQEVAAQLRARLVDEIATVEGQSVTVSPYPEPRDRGRFPETTVRRLKLDGRRLE